MAEQATIILADGTELHRIVKNVIGNAGYQQGDIVYQGKRYPVYRDLSMNPFLV